MERQFTRIHRIHRMGKREDGKTVEEGEYYTKEVEKWRSWAGGLPIQIRATEQPGS